MADQPDQKPLWCPTCGHSRHHASQCRQVYRDETNCPCTHECYPVAADAPEGVTGRGEPEPEGDTPCDTP